MTLMTTVAATEINKTSAVDNHGNKALESENNMKRKKKREKMCLTLAEE